MNNQCCPQCAHCPWCTWKANVPQVPNPDTPASSGESTDREHPGRLLDTNGLNDPKALRPANDDNAHTKTNFSPEVLEWLIDEQDYTLPNE